MILSPYILCYRQCGYSQKTAFPKKSCFYEASLLKHSITASIRSPFENGTPPNGSARSPEAWENRFCRSLAQKDNACGICTPLVDEWGSEAFPSGDFFRVRANWDQGLEQRTEGMRCRGALAHQTSDRQEPAPPRFRDTSRRCDRKCIAPPKDRGR